MLFYIKKASCFRGLQNVFKSFPYNMTAKSCVILGPCLRLILKYLLLFFCFVLFWVFCGLTANIRYRQSRIKGLKENTPKQEIHLAVQTLLSMWTHWLRSCSYKTFLSLWLIRSVKQTDPFSIESSAQLFRICTSLYLQCEAQFPLWLL